MSKIHALTDHFPLDTFGMLTPDVGGGYEDVHCHHQDSRQVLSSVVLVVIGGRGKASRSRCSAQRNCTGLTN